MMILQYWKKRMGKVQKWWWNRIKSMLYRRGYRRNKMLRRLWKQWGRNFSKEDICDYKCEGKSAGSERKHSWIWNGSGDWSELWRAAGFTKRPDFCLRQICLVWTRFRLRIYWEKNLEFLFSEEWCRCVRTGRMEAGGRERCENMAFFTFWNRNGRWADFWMGNCIQEPVIWQGKSGMWEWRTMAR